MKRILIVFAIILALMLSMASVYAAAKPASGTGCPMMQSGKANSAAGCPMMKGAQTTGKAATCPMMTGKQTTCPMSKTCATKCVKNGKCTVKGCAHCTGKCPMTKTCKTRAQCAAYMKAHCKCCQTAKTTVKQTAHIISAVCPVMGTKIPDVTKAAGKSVYKGKTYYFCCGGCKPAFDRNPAKYVK
jgi:YHS domain-containing protein